MYQKPSCVIYGNKNKYQGVFRVSTLLFVEKVVTEKVKKEKSSETGKTNKGYSTKKGYRKSEIPSGQDRIHTIFGGLA